MKEIGPKHRERSRVVKEVQEKEKYEKAVEENECLNKWSLH